MVSEHRQRRRLAYKAKRFITNHRRNARDAAIKALIEAGANYSRERQNRRLKRPHSDFALGSLAQMQKEYDKMKRFQIQHYGDGNQYAASRSLPIQNQVADPI